MHQPINTQQIVQEQSKKQKRYLDLKGKSIADLKPGDFIAIDNATNFEV